MKQLDDLLKEFQNKMDITFSFKNDQYHLAANSIECNQFEAEDIVSVTADSLEYCLDKCRHEAVGFFAERMLDNMITQQEVNTAFGETVVIPETSFETSDDISNYWKQLVECEMDYHLDDDPNQISWNPPLPEKQLQILVNNHESLWTYAVNSNNNPWDLIDIHYVKESILQDITKKFTLWFVLRECPSIRKITVRMWIESNYPDYKENESVIDYVFDNYQSMIEFKEPEDFRAFTD